MSAEKIKVSAPRSNPHICYISKEHAEEIKAIKEEIGLSLYNILCSVAGKNLDTSESIKQFKDELKEHGFHNIGEWATALVELLYSNKGHLNEIVLSEIKIERRNK